MSNLQINNHSGMKLNSLFDSLNKFYPYSKKTLGFDQEASFNFISDPENGEKLLGKTAYYDPSKYSVTIYVDSRHPKDIMRSISHELVHHAQNCRGDLSKISMAGEDGYAQKDSHLREMEREAYEKGNMIFRDWEDGVKSKNNNADTIYERVVKNWGYKMFKEDSSYQKIVKSKHNTRKARINKTGANKTKAAPFDRGSSSKRAKSAPPGAGLEENGENKVMDTKMIEEVVKSVLKRLRLEAGKDLDGDGDVDSDDYLKAKDNAIKKDMKKEAAGSEEQEVSEDDGIEEGSGDRNDPDREQGHGEQRQRASSSASGGKLYEVTIYRGLYVTTREPFLKAVRDMAAEVNSNGGDVQAALDKIEQDVDIGKYSSTRLRQMLSAGPRSIESIRGLYMTTRDKFLQAMTDAGELAAAGESEDSIASQIERGVDLEKYSDPSLRRRLKEFGADCEEDEEELVQESKKTLKSKFKKARREKDKKEMRRIKQHLNETKTLKDDLIRRKSSINERLMKRWFNHKE